MRRKDPYCWEQSNQAGTKLETNSLLESTQSVDGAMQAAVGSALGPGPLSYPAVKPVNHITRVPGKK